MKAKQEDFLKISAAVKHKPPPPVPVVSEEPFEEPPAEPTPAVPLAGEDAASPKVNPPPTTETALCEFLMEHERDAAREALAALVAEYVPDVVLVHPFTRAFVGAWRAGGAEGPDAITALRNELPPEMCVWLDHILLTEEKSASSELSPEKILKDFLRRLWMEAVRRRQGELPAESTPENDAARLHYSTVIRQLQRGTWGRACALMCADTLA